MALAKLARCQWRSDLASDDCTRHDSASTCVIFMFFFVLIFYLITSDQAVFGRLVVISSLV